MKDFKKKIIFMLSILVLILISFFVYIFLIKKEKLPESVITWYDTNTWSIDNSRDENIIKISNEMNLDEALKLQIKRFNDNNKKNLWDYSQLMWIYIDLWIYDKVVKLWKEALSLYEKQGLKDDMTKDELLSHMIQAYLYMWKLNEAETLINKYNNLKFLFEKIILEYKKWNYGYIISNYDEIKNESPAFIWFELDLLAKAYIKKWKNEEAIKMYEEIYQYWKDIKNDDVILETFYWYISSYSLKELYSKQWNTQKLDFYNSEFTSFKNRIDNEETLKGSSWDVKMNKKSMYFILNRQNEL